MNVSGIHTENNYVNILTYYTFRKSTLTPYNIGIAQIWKLYHNYIMMHFIISLNIIIKIIIVIPEKTDVSMGTIIKKISILRRNTYTCN